MPTLHYPNPATVDSWIVGERGIWDGGTQTASLEVDNNTGKMKWRVLWANRFDFCAYALGQSSIADDDVNLSRLLPIAFPGQPKWAATKILSIEPHVWEEFDDTIEPIGASQFDSCFIEILFEQVPYELREDDDTSNEMQRYITFPEDSQAAAEYISLPGAGFHSMGDGATAGSKLNGQPIPANIGRINPQETFVCTWHRLPDEAWHPDSNLYKRVFGTEEEIDTDDVSVVPYFGCINTVEIFGRPIGMLLLTGIKERRKVSPTGQGFEWDISFEFSYKPSGWNWIFLVNPADSTDTGWYMVSASKTLATADEVDDFDSIYNARDLTNLFSLFPVG